MSECWDMLKEWDLHRLAFEYRQAGRFPFDTVQLELSTAIYNELSKREQWFQNMLEALHAAVNGGCVWKEGAVLMDVERLLEEIKEYTP